MPRSSGKCGSGLLVISGPFAQLARQRAPRSNMPSLPPEMTAMLGGVNGVWALRFTSTKWFSFRQFPPTGASKPLSHIHVLRGTNTSCMLRRVPVGREFRERFFGYFLVATRTFRREQKVTAEGWPEGRSPWTDFAEYLALRCENRIQFIRRVSDTTPYPTAKTIFSHPH